MDTSAESGAKKISAINNCSPGSVAEGSLEKTSVADVNNRMLKTMATARRVYLICSTCGNGVCSPGLAFQQGRNVRLDFLEALLKPSNMLTEALGWRN